MNAIYLILVTKFDYGGWESVHVETNVWRNYFMIRGDAEKEIEELKTLLVSDPERREYKFCIQAVYLKGSEPRIVISDVDHKTA